MTARSFEQGGYRYAPGVSQYSAGVAAEPGYTLHRVRFTEPVPLAKAFTWVEAHLKSLGRPLQAFSACELRSPAPFTEQGFRDFNGIYTGTLKQWGVIVNGINPVARSNVCPAIAPPAEPSMHAFSYTVPDNKARPTFVVAG
ncbi:MAG: hypothetical protein RL758_670, partial [Pseudomonadota bacterium]